MSDSDDEQRRYQAILKDWLKDVEVPTAMLMKVVESNYLDDWTRLAMIPRDGKKTTSVRANRELCAVAWLCLERNYPMPDALRIHLAQAFRAGAEGKSMDDALGLKRKRGQSKDDDPLDQRQKERMIAWFMKNLIEIDDLSESEAKERACESYKLDTRTIEIYWALHKDVVHFGMFSTDEHRDIYRRLARVRQ